MLGTLFLTASISSLAPAAPVARAFTTKASDGTVVYGLAYRGRAVRAPVIVLFHQAGSSKAEYAQIAPRLTALGYNAVAIDQRAGGDLFGEPNETASHLGRSASYDETLADLEAALAWTKRAFPASPVYAWGSSYSAALVFVLAAKHPHDVAAVLAFSPNEYLNDKTVVRVAARSVSVPVFIDSAADPQEIAGAKAIYAALASKDKRQYVPAHGIHGSSTLLESRDPQGARENWDAVVAFLSSLPRAPGADH